MAGGIADDERTSALGLFNTARSYWRSAEHLHAANLKVTHPQAPVTFLYCHAIELYLKAHLRGAGKTVAELKKIGHRVADLAKCASEAGLVIVPEQSEVLSHVDEDSIGLEARYIVTGFKTFPTQEALSNAATHLDQSVSAALIKAGLPVRSETFETPKPQPSLPAQKHEALKADRDRVLVHMFSSYSGICDDNLLFVALRMDKNITRYHLDQLNAAGMVRRVSSHNNNVHWSITADGRQYVVENGLV